MGGKDSPGGRLSPRLNGRARLIAGAALLALAIPALAQKDAPESLLPPGFGDKPSEAPSPPPGPGRAPAAPAQNTPAPGEMPQLKLDLPTEAQAQAEDGGALMNVASVDDETLDPADQQKYDLPANARRSLARVGPLLPESGGLAANAFGVSNGRYLMAMMAASRAPFTSRWGSILLRRTLLSGVDTPHDVNGADWVAERAWLLVRMGEADAARMLVQSVDPDKYTTRLYAVAMQVYLASADPAGLCPITNGASTGSDAPGWTMARAMCAALSGDQGMASSALNQAQRQTDDNGNGVDYRLAAKIVGAGFNARRQVTVEWTGVDHLTAWRFGLATAANLDIPQPLFDTVGPQVRAWQARSPILALEKRQIGVETAARLGVFSSSALVDYYAQLAADPDAPPEFGDVAEAVRAAFSAGSIEDRVAGMKTLWDRNGGRDYLGQIAVARAAAALPVTANVGDAAPLLIGSMLAAGYDRNAAQWAAALGQLSGAPADESWALLAVGTAGTGMAADRLSGFIGADASADKHRSRLLLAGLAGLGRLSVTDAEKALDGVRFAGASAWSRAIDAAAARGEPGTVALMAAVGLQTRSWSQIPAFTLYHVVAALHRVGLDPDARMIAAEAISRT